MSLIDAVIAIGVNETNANIIADLDTVITLSTNTQSFTVNQLKFALNNDLNALRLVIGTLKSAGDADPLIWGFSQKIMTTGISFADDEAQAMIDSLAVAGSWPDNVRDAIKAIGVTKGKKYIQYGLGALPTDQDVTDAKNIIAKQQWFTSLLNNTVNAMLTDNVSTINDIKTAVGNA